MMGEEKPMTEEEARAILKARGWTWHIRTRRHGTPYLYAKRRIQDKIHERYIGPLSRLPQLSEQELITKLTR
jgi:hypothetical protein